jgi:hypoxanthine phosphoribosyltransferase
MENQENQYRWTWHSYCQQQAEDMAQFLRESCPEYPFEVVVGGERVFTHPQTGEDEFETLYGILGPVNPSREVSDKLHSFADLFEANYKKEASNA